MDVNAAIEQFFRLINLYISAEGTPQNYGGDTLLSRAEIHTLEVVGNNPGLSVTELARRQGISKSAVSQMLARLEAKYLVVHVNAPGSGRDTTIELSSAGRTAYENHAAGHRSLYHTLEKRLQTLPAKTLEEVASLLRDIEFYLKDWIAKGKE